MADAHRTRRTLSRPAATALTSLFALALTATLVVRTSTAAFVALTDNPGNALEAGTIALADDDSGSTLLTLANVAPGESTSECITVVYTGTLDPEPVRVYSTSELVTVAGTDATARNMQSQVRVTVEEGAPGSGGSFGDCGGFVPAGTIVSRLFLDLFDAAYTDYDSGRGQWDPSVSGESRVYRVTLELDVGADDTWQASRLEGIALTWETQSAPAGSDDD